MGTAALAQTPETPAEAPVPAPAAAPARAAPNPTAGEPASTPAPAATDAAPASPAEPPSPPEVAPLLPLEFHQQVIGWDVTRHEAYQGREHRPLSREELFTALDRPDLLTKQGSLVTRRVALAVGAGLALAAGIAGGVAAFSQDPDLNTRPCIDRVDLYNQCSDKHRLMMDLGFGSLGLGVIAAALLATFAYWANPNVLDDDEAQRLISHHNAELLKKLRLKAWLLPGGGAVGAQTSF